MPRSPFGYRAVLMRAESRTQHCVKLMSEALRVCGVGPIQSHGA